MPEPPEHSIFYYNETTTPLGQLTLAGASRNGLGVMPRTPMRVFGSYAIMLLLRGKGAYRDANDLTAPVLAGVLIMVFPELAHMYGPDRGTVWDEEYFIFSGKPFDNLREVGLLDSARPVIRLNDHELWRRKLLAVVTQPLPLTPSSRMLQASRFLNALTEVLIAARGQDDTDNELWLSKAKMLLGDKLREDLAPSDVARTMAMGYEIFRKRFERLTGTSPIRYRNTVRLEAARDMLRFTSMSSQQISENLGFSDEYYFSKRFKQAAGVSPREFRRLEVERR